MSEDADLQRRRLTLRIAFLAALAGGLLFWSRARNPKDLELVVDLTAALPGELTELDVVVTRNGRALLRSDRRYGKLGAPQRESYQLRAAPGPAEVEATLLSPPKAARRQTVPVQLVEGAPAVVTAR